MFEIKKIVCTHASHRTTYAPAENYSIKTNDISKICEEYEKLNYEEELVVKDFGKDQNMDIIFFVGNNEKFIEILVNGEIYGVQKIDNIQNLLNFLTLIYENPKIGSIDACKILLTSKEKVEVLRF